uniref:Uncharacterized protein n=1 Tax=Anopheles dirus TaxID=7168 RepID=A0A182N9M2_9DIPT
MQEMYKPCLEEQTVTQLTTYVRNNLDKSSSILEKLPNIEKSLENISGKLNIMNDKPMANFKQDDIKKWAFNLKVNKKEQENMSFEEILAVIDRAIELNRGFALRNTQRLAVLALLTNGQSTLAQVSTGEGKSLIVVAVSIIKALSGRKVDIITSSSVLAKRDAEVNKDIYSMFGVEVSHNCSEDEEKRKDAYSYHQIVYGDLASFQRDYLLDRFYGKRILGARDFAVAIVDEVDSMLLDKGNNMLYLSHDIPGMDKLESLYVFIWQMVNSPSDDSDEELVQEIKKAVLSNLYKTVTLDDIKSLDSSMTDKQARDISSCLVTDGVLDDDGRILTKTVDESVKKLNQSLSTDLVSYKDRLCFLLTECIRDEKPFNIPNFLKKFVERHLTAWITSAINALFMIPGESYIVASDKSGSSTDRNANIIILDSDTGTDQASSQWDEALHQFLQLKHGCRLSMQSLKAVFISNVSYFKEYDLLYGLTGTLGSQPERELLQEEHGVDFVTIPTAKSKQFAEYDSIVCSDERAWKRNIRSEVEMLLNEQKRSVLIICETINDVESLKKVFVPLNPSNVHLYTRDYQKFDIANGSNQLAQGQIIIATNLAGRGTDIQISDDLKHAGGLHVILSYLPANIRIEEQAFGRAARCGDKGSGRMIVMISGEEESNRQSKIFEVKKNRDASELCRLSHVKKYYETTIRTEESCFDEFKRVYRKNKDRLCDSKVPKAIIDILMHSCLNRWAFWLDENSTVMREVGDQAARQYVEGLLKSFTAELSDLQDGYGINTYKDEESPGEVNIPYFNSMEWHVWVEENPNQMLKLAKVLTEKSVEQHAPKIQNIDTACSHLLDNFIEREPYFCESAYYYSACLLLKHPLEYADKVKNIEKLKQNLRKARNLFEKHSAFALQASNIVGSFKGFLGWSDGYKEQKRAEAHIYQQFQHSIDDLLGHAITPESFVNHDIDDDISERIFEDIIKAGIVTKPKVRKTIDEEQLRNIHQDYGVPITALKKFLSKNAGPIEETQFIAESQKWFKFPSREQFWDILVEQKVLYEEQSIVVVDIKRLQAADPSLTDFIVDMVNKQTLTKRTIALSENQIVLRHEQLIASVNEIETNDKNPEKTSITTEDAEVKKAENNEAKDETTNVDLLNGEPQDPIAAQKETNANTEESTGENLAEASQRVHMSPNDEKNPETHVQHGQERQDFVAKQESDNREYIFEKEEFYSVVGKKNYDTIKSKGLISLNKMADIDRSKIASCVFSSFNSINVKDITEKTNICESEAALIISELAKHNIIKQEGESYDLQMESISGKQVLLPSYPVYEGTVKSLLKSCFPYKFTLKNLEHQLNQRPPVTIKDIPGEEKQVRNPVVITLRYQPHQLLFQDLIIQDIICPPKIKTIIDEGKLRQSSNKLSNQNDYQPDVGIVCDIHKFYFQDPPIIYDVNDETSKCENVHVLRKVEPDCQVSYDLGKNVEKYLKYILLLTKKEALTHIESVLNNCASPLRKLGEPSVNLKHIRDSNKEINFGHFEEQYTFILNGMEHFIRLEEKKWTAAMLRNVSLTALFGVAQIIAAAIIEVYSAGAMTHVASGLISEGMNDLSYCVSALQSGFFTWKEYLKQKAISVFFTMASSGIAAYFSRGAKASRIASKLAPPGYIENGVELAKLSGKKMRKQFGDKVFFATVKRIVSRASQGIVNGMISGAADHLVDTYLHQCVSCLVNQALADMEGKIENHSVINNLEKLYYALGREKTLSLVRQATSTQFAGEWEEYVSVSKRICTSVLQGLGSAMQKSGSKSSNMKILGIISKIVNYADHAVHLLALINITNRVFDNIDKEIGKKLQEHSISTDSNTGVDRSDSHKEKSDYANFKKEVVAEWKSQLSEHVSKVFAQHLLKPLVNDALSFIENHVKRLPHLIKEAKLKRDFKKAKKHYDKNKNKAGMTREMKKQLMKQYHDKVLKIMYKTKSPSLFAAVIKENVPMDLICVGAFVSAATQILKRIEIDTPVSITVYCEKGGEQTFCSDPSNSGAAQHIPLHLSDNHFSFSGTESQSDVTGNNCLFAALCQAIPQLRDIGADGFRKNVADSIANNPAIRRLIKKGLHRYTIKHANALGGARRDGVSLRKRQKNHAVHLLALINITNRVFNNIDKEIGKKLQEHSTSTDSNTGVDKSDSHKENSDYANFKKEVVAEWKSQLSEHVSKVFDQHLLKPLVNDALSFIENLVKRLPRLIKEAKLKRDLKKAKKHYDKNKNKAGMTREMKKQLMKQYHDKVLKIMYKTKSPSLFAAVIKENVPMDLICVGAFVLAAPAILQQMEIDTQLIITVSCEKNAEQTLCSEPSKSGAAHHIQLNLNDNHFSFSGTESQSDVTGNNCLLFLSCEMLGRMDSEKMWQMALRIIQLSEA